METKEETKITLLVLELPSICHAKKFLRKGLA
jgi:hypothetical protein